MVKDLKKTNKKLPDIVFSEHFYIVDRKSKISKQAKILAKNRQAIIIF